MNVWEIIKAAGVPAILLGVIVTTWIQIKAVKKGVQALLRDRLIQGYNYHSHQGFVGIADRDNMENVYQQYHALGANGVMDDLRAKFLALPIEDPQGPAPHQQAGGQPAGASPAS